MLFKGRPCGEAPWKPEGIIQSLCGSPHWKEMQVYAGFLPRPACCHPTLPHRGLWRAPEGSQCKGADIYTGNTGLHTVVSYWYISPIFNKCGRTILMKSTISYHRPWLDWKFQSEGCFYSLVEGCFVCYKQLEMLFTLSVVDFIYVCRLNLGQTGLTWGHPASGKPG